MSLSVRVHASTARTLEMTKAMLSGTGIVDTVKDGHAEWKQLAKSKSERRLVRAALDMCHARSNSLLCMTVIEQDSKMRPRYRNDLIF